MSVFFKLTRANGRDLYTDTVDYRRALQTGEPVKPRDRWDASWNDKPGLCGSYVLHAAAKARHCFTGRVVMPADKPNPWAPLLEMWNLGTLPIGFCDGEYLIWVPEVGAVIPEVPTTKRALMGQVLQLPRRPRRRDSDSVAVGVSLAVLAVLAGVAVAELAQRWP